MFKYIPLIKQVLTERRTNSKLREQSQRNSADIDYIAMMCDVELEPEEERINE